MNSACKSELREYIRVGINATNLSYEEIAHRCGFNSARVIKAIAEGKLPVPIDQASAIADAIGCDPDRFIVLVLRTVLPDDVILHMGRAILRHGKG